MIPTDLNLEGRVEVIQMMEWEEETTLACERHGLPDALHTVKATGEEHERRD